METALKQQISDTKLAYLADKLQEHYPAFDRPLFITLVKGSDWASIGLKQRIRKVSQALHQSLPFEYPQQIAILLSVHEHFDGLFHWVFADFVEVYGLSDLATSMQALTLITQQSTAEFAVRPFIESYPDKMHKQLIKWAQSSNYHHRRLASESVRPNLPWAKHLRWVAQNPDWVRPIIDLLRRDEQRYVQKSVANLLNDLSKTQPQWVYDLISQWNLSNHHSYWIARHALRSLLKQGEKTALELLGYPAVGHISVSDLNFDSVVKKGHKWKFSFHLHASSELGLLRLEYAIWFLRNNQTYHRKVFKISEKNFALNARDWRCQHDFKSISTRTYYPGVHRFELILNGQIMAQTEFRLID